MQLHIIYIDNSTNFNTTVSCMAKYLVRWAIGTGKTATPEQANEVHEYIRAIISGGYSAAAAERLIIQYGGSVKPDNAKELLSMPHIDGALVGGASLKADDFAGIVLA